MDHTSHISKGLKQNANHHVRQSTFYNPGLAVPEDTISQQQIYLGAHSNELDEIKVTTQVLTQEVGSMRKLIEDLHISANEKDAEIIRLKMHLGDEKAATQRMRH